MTDIYDGHHANLKMDSKRPSVFKTLIKDPESYQKKADKLVMSLNENTLIDMIRMNIKKLLKKGVTEIYLLGFGFGANVCLRYLESIDQKHVKTTFAWYPHLLKPLRNIKTELKSSPKIPNLKKINNTKIIIFHGDKDTIVEPGNLEKAKEYAAALPNVELVAYKGAKHGFAEKFIQGWIPNLPYYWFCPANWRAHRLSWQRVFQELEQIAK